MTEPNANAQTTPPTEQASAEIQNAGVNTPTVPSVPAIQESPPVALPPPPMVESTEKESAGIAPPPESAPAEIPASDGKNKTADTIFFAGAIAMAVSFVMRIL